jgi:hypothetical protein
LRCEELSRKVIPGIISKDLENDIDKQHFSEGNRNHEDCGPAGGFARFYGTAGKNNGWAQA